MSLIKYLLNKIFITSLSKHTTPMLYDADTLSDTIGSNTLNLIPCSLSPLMSSQISSMFLMQVLYFEYLEDSYLKSGFGLCQLRKLFQNFPSSFDLSHNSLYIILYIIYNIYTYIYIYIYIYTTSSYSFVAIFHDHLLIEKC